MVHLFNDFPDYFYRDYIPCHIWSLKSVPDLEFRFQIDFLECQGRLGAGSKGEERERKMDRRWKEGNEREGETERGKARESGIFPPSILSHTCTLPGGISPKTKLVHFSGLF